jgi:hypothetical protein
MVGAIEPDLARLTQSMVAFAWGWMATGIFTGLIFGLWSFEGPLPEPKSVGAYDSCARRLMRLGHVAFIMLPLISMSYAAQIGGTSLSPETKILAVRLCWLGMVGVPTVCMTSAFWRPTKYLFPIPAVSFFICLVMMAVGKAG